MQEWEKWNLEGTARPEVPLCAKTNDDCYVAGMALDFTSTAPVQLSQLPFFVVTTVFVLPLFRRRAVSSSLSSPSDLFN